MAVIKKLLDKEGVIYKANKILPSKYHTNFIKALAELEDNECHRTSKFPITQLHKIEGSNNKIYRAYVDKISGWRIHVQYENGCIVLCDIIEGQRHDQVLKIIKTTKNKYK